MMGRRVWVWAVAAVLLGAGRAWAASEAAVFRFDPGDNVAHVMGVKLTQKVELPGGLSQTQTSGSQEKQVASHTEQGYRVQSTVTEAAGLDGARTNDPVLSAMKGKVLTFTADREGKLVSIEGMDAVAADLQKLLPAALAQSVTPDFLTAAAKAEWASSITSYVGHRAEVGEVWVAVDDVPLPDNRMGKCYTARKVTAPVTLGSRQYLRVESKSDSDPAQLREFIGEAADKALAGLKPFPKTVKISGEASCVLDPQTLDCAELKATRRIEGNMSMPVVGELPLTVTEVREAKEVPAAPASGKPGTGKGDATPS